MRLKRILPFLLLCVIVNHSALAATSVVPLPNRVISVSSDTLVSGAPAILHTVTCQSDTAATAGSIIIYDNTAESGKKIWEWTVSAVEYEPRTLLFDAEARIGLYIGFTTTADVTCTLTFLPK
jgi:hypothetical protein